MEILNIKNLSFRYPLSSHPVLSSISLSIKKGEFAVLCGPTGCGKSTLLRMLKRELTPVGELTGDVIINGIYVQRNEDRNLSSMTGFVSQKPEQQIVTDKVWHELAFGPENHGVPSSEISRRVAEICCYFGINDWYNKNTSDLSGGQKQILNLASVLVMQPEILILDEPTSQLDPIAGAEFISAVRRLNEELSLTVIMTEHRLEDIIPVCDKLIIMEEGKITAVGSPDDIITRFGSRKDIIDSMPSASRIYTTLEKTGKCPLTVKEGRKYIENSFENRITSLPEPEVQRSEETALEFHDVMFRYEKNSADILRGMSFSVRKGEIYCILGGNGSGKSTTLSVAAGLVRAYSGEIKIFGKNIRKYKNQSLYRSCTALLPQDVQTVFLKNTVAEELRECGADTEQFPFDISALMDRHPYDLSGGEQQIIALAKVLASNPRLILFDEPTKGLDPAARQNMTALMKSLRDKGRTIIAVTHDVEFAAECSDRCALIFNGTVVSEGPAGSFFAGNTFYTTSVSRMTKGYFKRAVTVNDAVELCLQNGRKEYSGI